MLRYWERTLRHGDVLELVLNGVHRRKKSRMFYQDLLSLLGIGAENEET